MSLARLGSGATGYTLADNLSTRLAVTVKVHDSQSACDAPGPTVVETTGPQSVARDGKNDSGATLPMGSTTGTHAYRREGGHSAGGEEWATCIWLLAELKSFGRVRWLVTSGGIREGKTVARCCVPVGRRTRP